MEIISYTCPTCLKEVADLDQHWKEAHTGVSLPTAPATHAELVNAYTMALEANNNLEQARAALDLERATASRISAECARLEAARTDWARRYGELQESAASERAARARAETALRGIREKLNGPYLRPVPGCDCQVCEGLNALLALVQEGLGGVNG